MTTETAAKKDVQKLQRAIVDGLEDVKAQDIVVFNTADISPLFERVIVASGTSNRQTKALASSVRSAVQDAGFDKPRIEGEDNGEWIIVDCGAAVCHIMQPVIRQYYRLEEIWGAKPLRLKHGTDKPAQAKAEETTTKKAPAKKAAARKTAQAPARSGAAVVKAVAKTVAAKAPAKAAPAKKVAAAKKAAPAKAAPAKTGVAKAGAARKPAAKKVLPKMVVNAPVAKKSAAKKTAAAKPVAKPAAKKPAAKKPAAKSSKNA
jgi:ribosome-associated protein